MCKSPNILCISIDSLRADYSFLRPSVQTSPFLSELAEDATVYDQAISPSTWTLPVHASAFTGLYPAEHQLNDHDEVLGESHPTLAELLSENGYTTKSFGYNGWLETGGVTRGFTHHSGRDNRKKGYISNFKDKFAKATLQHQWKDETTVTKVKNQIQKEETPFYYFLHLNGVHYPYRPSRPYHKKFTQAPKWRIALNFIRQGRLFDSRPEIYVGNRSLSPDTISLMKDLYKSCIFQADSLIKDLYEVLVSQDLEEETILVIFGDHGDLLGEGGWIGHQYTVADEIIRVPLLIRDPTRKIQTGLCQDVVQINDLYPTLASLCNISAPETNSIDLSQTAREAAFVHYSAPASFEKRVHSRVSKSNLPPRKQYAIWRNSDQKVIWHPEIESINDLESDPNLLRLFKEHFKELNPIEQSHSRNQISRETLDHLEQMGYL